MKIDSIRLTSFLEKANKQTYASNGIKSKSTRLASEDFDFVDGELTYHDTYFGSDRFIGEEIVYDKNQPVWGMNYYGWIVGDVSGKEVYEFLKKSLMQDYSDILPVRGPREFQSDGWKYMNQLTGNLDNFIGEELIYHDDVLVYKAYCHGGCL